MFDADARRKGFRFERFGSVLRDEGVYIVCRMSRCEQYRVRFYRVPFSRFRILYGDPRDAFFAAFRFREKIHALRAAVKFAAERNDFFTHRVYDFRKLVRADVRMRVGEDRSGRTEKVEHGKNAADVSAFCTSRVKLSVTERAGASFSETVIAVAVDGALRADLRYRLFAIVRFFAPLDDYRRDAVFKQAERTEQSCGAGADDDDALRSVGRLPYRERACRALVGSFSDIRFADEADTYTAVPCIDRALYDCESYVFGSDTDVFFRKRFRRFAF